MLKFCMNCWSYIFPVIYINDLSGDIVCNIAISDDDTTLYSKFDQASDLWQQLELALVIGLHYLYCQNHFQENWGLDSFDEVSFS